ncbi:hypothetical protein [Legionella cherrii]|uniref:N-acetyltransferase domain-containing protein n=2 Tax=Legionella cherrii TaxID=28084 RepID=A0ABY6T783_9GAMM|nr:hypothetical protein [Legionella cherrii]VEB35569.1 Uncharacterised protein [Legionella cherrii]
MKVRKLNYPQFKLEKQKILSLMREWQKTANEFFEQNYSRLSNSDLHYHWRESVRDMIIFLEKDIPENDERNFEKNDFAFFIAEDDDIQGIALGSGPHTYRSNSNEFFGIRGTFFEIEEMIISAPSMLSRCYSIEGEGAHKRIGKELLKAVVDHVSTLDNPYPISARPHYNNRTAHDFFEKNLFELECGSIGHSYRLKVANFVNIDKNIHQELMANKSTVVIEDYESLSLVPF